MAWVTGGKIEFCSHLSMSRLRFGIRLKLLFLSLFLFAIPWLGYKYVWELERYLRIGQEQTMLGTARAVATALHERPALFDSQSSFLSDVKPGTDLYAHNIGAPIRLDGELNDWAEYQGLMIDYDQQYLINNKQDYRPKSLSFRHMVGQYGSHLYAMFAVVDEAVLFRRKNSLRVDLNDYLQIAMTDENGGFQRYIVAPVNNGWVNAYLLVDDVKSLRPARVETRIQGHWQNTQQGYNLELRFPLGMMSKKIAFAIADVDEPQSRALEYLMGTANPSQIDSLGTVLVPSPEIENILQALKYSNARVWVVDQHMRVLARSGSIHKSIGLGSDKQRDISQTWWEQIETQWLLPIYYKILTKPPTDFIDDLKGAFALGGEDIELALKGQPDSTWRLSPDNKALILSAAHPIFIDGIVRGAVVVEQTTHGIRTLRNKALEQLFHIIIAVMGLGTLALFLFASRISSRIRTLRNETEKAIDGHGKIVANIQSSNTQDEIGDLSRTFANVLGRLGQYNSYLENMASRLSHELRTPVAIVNSSLEMLAIENDEKERSLYLMRAQQGIKRLSKILSNMSEATRLEQAIQGSERESFMLDEVIDGCVAGYRIAYASRRFELHLNPSQSAVNGSAELFAQMLDKIITNAVEFSQEDSIITVTLEKTNNKHQLSISNHGMLLPQNMQAQLLDSMVSVRPQQNTEAPHLGLGLYIAKMIADYHGADLSIANLKDGSGVAVTLVL
jgi:two-component system sensor histidine kinase ChvG